MSNMSGTMFPQEIAKSKSFGQNYVKQMLEPIRAKPDIFLCVYMDDIILGWPRPELLWSVSVYAMAGGSEEEQFDIVTGENSDCPTFKILGTQITLDRTTPRKPWLPIQKQYKLPELQRLHGRY